jgi:predicted signal transduction protein with EAL and GGDEF domain
MCLRWAGRGRSARARSATEQFNLLVVALSIGAAVAFSCAALWIAFASRHSQEHVIRTRLAASWVMGIGIASMHSIVMTVTRFTLYALPLSTWHTVNVGVLGETAIAMMTILVFLMALGTSTLDKWRFQDLKKANADLIVAQQALLGFQQKLTDANAKLVELSVRDGLTGLYNRRHFDGALDSYMMRKRSRMRRWKRGRQMRS